MWFYALSDFLPPGTLAAYKRPYEISTVSLCLLSVVVTPFLPFALAHLIPSGATIISLSLSVSTECL